MTRKLAALMGLGALALGFCQPATAQVVAATPGFVGFTKSSVAGCPNIGWRLVRHTDSPITGIAYYADASGASSVSGSGDSSGKFTLQLASTMGKGPAGTVTGQRSADGALEADLKGEGCANAHLKIQGVPNIANAAGG